MKHNLIPDTPGVTEKVILADGRLTVPGTLVREIAPPQSPDDASAPGLVLRVQSSRGIR